MALTAREALTVLIAAIVECNLKERCWFISISNKLQPSRVEGATGRRGLQEAQSPFAGHVGFEGIRRFDFATALFQTLSTKGSSSASLVNNQSRCPCPLHHIVPDLEMLTGALFSSTRSLSTVHDPTL
jgi:hypothetical protein